MPTPPRFGACVLAIFSIGVALPLLGSASLRLYAGDWTWQQQPLHSLAEGMGAFIALALAALLRTRSRLNLEPHPSLWIACALISMGLLDAAHAAALPGETFVWLHSVATFCGGLLFALVWLPEAAARRVGHMHLTLGIALLTALSIAVWVGFPELAPRMLSEGAFTPLARLLNLTGGLLFYTAALHFTLRCRRSAGSWDDLLFAVHCALFGSAGVLFELSQLWDASWWWWHLLRLGAYAVAISYIGMTYWAAEQRVLALNRDLELSNRELEDFAQIAAHDLREPLRKIVSFSDLLSRDLGSNLPDLAKKDLFFIRDGAQRMQELTRSLLVLSRVGRTKMNLAPIAVDRCVDQALENLELRIRESRARIFRAELPVVRADATLLTSVYQNLIHNALKFVDGAPPEIHLEVERETNHWVFGVRDNGIGIDPARGDDVFKPFQRLHARETYQGAGIGLSICRRAVERHGGRIWITWSSRPGAHFHFTLES